MNDANNNLEKQLEEHFKVVYEKKAILAALRSKDWQLKRPIEIKIEILNNGLHVACIHDVNLFGDGWTIGEAVSNLEDNMTSQHESLCGELDEGYRLSPPLEKQLEFLKGIIEKGSLEERYKFEGGSFRLGYNKDTNDFFRIVKGSTPGFLFEIFNGHKSTEINIPDEEAFRFIHFITACMNARCIIIEDTK